MRRLRELAALIGVSVTALALVLLGAAPSTAGGPTSVLLASPTSAQTASLYTTDKEYSLLQNLLGTPGESLDVDGDNFVGEERPPENHGDAGHMINVTWLIHDVEPWRHDQVYTSVPKTKTIWILTTTSPRGNSNAVWHQAERPAELRDLLTELGVMGRSSGDTSAGTDDGNLSGNEPAAGSAAGSADQAQDQGQPPAEAATVRTDTGTDWWWGIPPALAFGVALGSCGTLLIRRAATRHQPGPPREPRQELLDV
ncbi:hypothetical protein [Streptomyces sp. NPDC002845]